MSGLNRRESWERAFLDEYNRHDEMAFEYGRHDCCLAVSDVVKAMTGVDLLKALRGYKTVRGATTRLLKHGGVAGIIEAAAKKHGIEEVPPRFAQRGDMVLLDTEQGDALGIMWLDGRTARGASLDGGWTPLPWSAVKRAWRI